MLMSLKDSETFPAEPYKIKLKENYMPARNAPRKVPIHLQDNFHQEMYNLVKQRVLERSEHSTEWVNSFVIVEIDVSMDSGNSHAPHHQNHEEATNLFRSKRSQ